jgi:tetratricopeptide (TPR) repeat protein
VGTTRLVLRGFLQAAESPALFSRRLGECLDDDAIASYVTRHLRGPMLERVEQHLSVCDDCLAITCAAAPLDAAPAPPQRDIGRYRVVGMLGEGGMGSVFVAHDPQLDRDVALKLVRSDHRTQPEMHARLAREARAMARVRHPNVVAVYDAGEVDDGVYIAMELVEGETLRRWLARERRAWQDIVRMFVQAGRGLAAAHAAAIVHRDFKPENVLVDAAGRVAVGDFGLASVPDKLELAHTLEVASPHGANAQLVTTTGAQVGTPRYMSPEQFRAEPVDPRTDQFSFAVALYEALYGRPPVVATSLAQLADAVTRGELAPPTPGAVPAAVARAIERALAVDRAKRFPDMAALLAELDAAIRPRARRGWLVAAAAVVVVAASAVIAASLATRDAPADPPAGPPVAAPATTPVTGPSGVRTRVLVGTFDNRGGSDEVDDVVDPVVAEVLASSSALDTYSGVDLRPIEARFGATAHGDAFALADKVGTTAARPLLAVGGTIERTGDGFTLRLVARQPGATAPRFDRARRAGSADDLVAAAVALAGALRDDLDGSAGADDRTPPLSSSVAAIHAYAAGQRLAFTGDFAAAVDADRRALALDPHFVEARAALGLALDNVPSKENATIELGRAVAEADRLPERRRLTLLGDYYGTAGRFGEAIVAYQQLLARWPGDGRTQINLAVTALEANAWPLALDVARAAARDHADNEVARRDVVIAEVGNGRFDDAARDGAALLAELPHPSGPAATTTAVAYALLGRSDDARAVIAKLAALDPDLIAHATADLAMYEGRLDDAAAALTGRSGAVDQLVLAWLRARQGDAHAAAAAARAAMADESMPGAYLAASAAVSAGDTAGADAKARAWSDAPEVDRRMYGALLAGDLALAEHHAADAVAAYRAAGRIEDAWLAHERLARGELAAADAAGGERELRWCLDHRGQGAVVANPSLSLVPEVALLLARSLDRRRADAAAVRAAYRAVADLAPSPQHDPWTDEARRRAEPR